MNQSLYTLFLDTISISLCANGNSYSQHRGRLMKNESEKLKYQTPHHTHGAPDWGAQWNRIHIMELRDTVHGM